MSVILAPLACLYGSIMRLRRWLYQRGLLRSRQLPGFVISVGNLEAGGTGKSPVVMALATSLLEHGAHPAILTRGYRSGLSSHDSAVLLGSELLLPPEHSHEFHADEATMQARTLMRVPVIIGARRWAAAQRYLKKYPAPTHWILDDGFQHLKLRRQYDIVLLDAKNPVDNGRCLPAGRLREWPSALKNAHLVLLTRAHDLALPDSLKNLTAPIVPVFFANGEPRQIAGPRLSFTAQKSILLALGIAQPQRVIDYCRRQNYPVTDLLLTADHSLFPQGKLQQQLANADALLTTEKDFWRQAQALSGLQKPVYVLPLELTFPPAFTLSRIVSLFTESLQ